MANKNFIVKNGLEVTGNITVTGNFNGRSISGDGTKLDNIENEATADQTASEIRTLVASATDSNVFTDAHQTKLGGIDTDADVTDATNVYNSLGVTAGTATASKALVVDANKDITLGTGDFTCTNCTVTGTLTETSAAVYKENINPLSNQLENIMKLRPVEYDKKATGEHEIGLIADEVEKILPDFVTQKNGIADSLNYSRMVSVLVKAVQELTEKVEELSK